MTEQKQEIFNGNFIVGERYMTRSGDEATYMGVNPYRSPLEDPYVFAHKGSRSTYSHYPNGSYSQNTIYGFDILCRIKPRKKLEVWANLYDGSVFSEDGIRVSVYNNKEEANKYHKEVNFDYSRIACVPITIEYTEGEGL